MSQIKDIKLHCILNSKGKTTIWADVILLNNIIGHVAVSGQIKTGSLCRTNRDSKYNQLFSIEERVSLPFSTKKHIKCEKENKKN